MTKLEKNYICTFFLIEIKKLNMKKICFVALAALVLSACNSEPKFKVEGEVSGADGKMLYLEAAASEGIVPLDSVKLKEIGRAHV